MSKTNDRWTEKDLAFLRKHYPKKGADWVAKKLGRTTYGVRYKASSLKIRCEVWPGGRRRKATRKPVAEKIKTRSSKPAKTVDKGKWTKLQKYFAQVPELRGIFLEIVLDGTVETGTFLEKLREQVRGIFKKSETHRLAVAIEGFQVLSSHVHSGRF